MPWVDMQDNPFTDPATIRAAYGARGRNRRINTARVEALGVGSSQISPTTVSGGGGSSVGAGSVAAGGSGSSVALEPYLATDPGVDYTGGTYEENLYTKDYVRPGDIEPIL